jgi:hypothetical protein
VAIQRENVGHYKSAAESVKRSADVAEHSLTIVERAFITISDISITTIAQHRTIIDHRIHINVINPGRTPAKNYASQTNLVVLDDIPDDFRFADRPHEELPKTVVGPQSRTYILVDFFIQDAIATYQKNKKTLIYGWIEYDDIFPHTGTHRTEFCIAVEVFADPRETPEVIYGKSIPIMTLRPYGRYNAYDDDCLYRPGQTPVAREGELPPLTQPPTVSPPAGLPSETGT